MKCKRSKISSNLIFWETMVEYLALVRGFLLNSMSNGFRCKDEVWS